MRGDHFRKGLDKDRADRLKSLLDTVVSINRGKSDTSFSAQAAARHGRECDGAEPVPFEAFWPTFDAMSEAQSEWYYCWRSRVRAGEFPDADLSYIFVYIYELINNVEISSPVAAMRRLFDIWIRYRGTYRRLDRYLVPWIEDYMLVNADAAAGDASADAGAFYAQLRDSGADERLINLFPDYAVSRYTSGKLGDMPIELLSQFSDYDFYKGKFFLEGGCGDFMLGILPRALSRADAFLRNGEGKGVFEKYRPEPAQRRHRIPFSNAVYDGGVRSVEIPAPSYIRHQPLRDFISSIFKCAENALRAAAGYKGRLKAAVAEPGLEREVGKFVKAEYARYREQQSRVPITVDLARIVQLIEESNEVRVMLLENTQDEPEPAPAAATAPAHAAAPAPGPSVGRPIFSDLQRRIIKFIRDGGDAAAGDDISSAFPGVLIQLEIDAVNEIAMETVGDVLIYEADGVWTLEAGYLGKLGL